MSAPLNLARRPFRNERLPTLALAAGCAGLVLATAWHALVARDLAPGRSRDVATEVGAIEKEIDDLRAESAELRKVDVPADTLKEWSAVKRLVDRRAFSWTGLFGALEEALPPAVKLLSISPGEAREGTELKLAAVGRSNEDALALLASLQGHADFDGAFLDGWKQAREGFDITCTVRYAPKARPAAGKAAGARRQAADPPAEGGE